MEPSNFKIVFINNNSKVEEALDLHELLQANGHDAFCEQKWQDENPGRNIRLDALNAIESYLNKVIVIFWDEKLQRDRKLYKEYIEAARDRINDTGKSNVLQLSIVFEFDKDYDSRHNKLWRSFSNSPIYVDKTSNWKEKVLQSINNEKCTL